MWQKHNESQLKSPPVKLDAQRRQTVENAIRECCEKRRWQLLAFNIRTNHVHTVADIGLKKPEFALNAFKANATRLLRENGLWTHEHSPWAAKGSKRRLWNEKQVADAIDYVINGQGDDLPRFD